MAGRKKESYWAQYQSLLVRRPYFMNITQGGLLAAAGTAADIFIGAADMYIYWFSSV